MSTTQIEKAAYQSLRYFAPDGGFTNRQCRAIALAVAAGVAQGIEEYKQRVDYRPSKAEIERVHRYNAHQAWRTMRSPKWKRSHK